MLNVSRLSSAKTAQDSRLSMLANPAAKDMNELKIFRNNVSEPNINSFKVSSNTLFNKSQNGLTLNLNQMGALKELDNLNPTNSNERALKRTDSGAGFKLKNEDVSISNSLPNDLSNQLSGLKAIIAKNSAILQANISQKSTSESLQTSKEHSSPTTVENP